MTYDAAPYARFIAASGEPALELGCGDGVPMLDLRAQGIEVEGLDSSPDMLARLRVAAKPRGVDVVLHCQSMETMDLPRRYRSIYLAGPTFNLLPDDEATIRALSRIHAHLRPGGSALIPLFIPVPTPAAQLGIPREAEGEDGSVLRVTTMAVDRDDAARNQMASMRYERVDPAGVSTVLERPWLLHWHTQSGFREMAASVGLATRAVLDAEGGRADADADTFVFVLSPS